MKKIIIDGVDVNGCRFLVNRFSDRTDYCCSELDTLLKCTKRNCYFKQLARKTQECKELKAYAQRQENQREKYYKEYLKKSKALEEIEKEVVINCEEICGKKVENCTDISCSSIRILDIINKAKEE